MGRGASEQSTIPPPKDPHHLTNVPIPRATNYNSKEIISEEVFATYHKKAFLNI